VPGALWELKKRPYNFLMVTTPIDTVTYTEAARGLLRPEDCALAVIDIQEKLLPPIFEKERLVRNSRPYRPTMSTGNGYGSRSRDPHKPYFFSSGFAVGGTSPFRRRYIAAIP
jgi:hypothetical protein